MLHVEEVRSLGRLLQSIGRTEEAGMIAEAIRRSEVERLHSRHWPRTWLENEYGKVWDTSELAAEFEVNGFLAPFVVVKRRCDGVVGSLSFQASPRFYFDWEEFDGVLPSERSACENCGRPAEYDTEMCLCAECREEVV